MASDADRYCSNCRTVIPRGATACPNCDVYAGDVFDGKLPKQRRKSSGALIALFLMVAAGAGAYWYLNQRPQLPRADTGPVRVVGDRPGGARRAPGAAISEAEAVVTLRHYFASQAQPDVGRTSVRPDGLKPVPHVVIKSECLALISKGDRDGQYIFDAINICDRARLGRWKVDAKTKIVSH